MDLLEKVVAFLRELKISQPDADKEVMRCAYIAEFHPTRRGALFIGDGYGICFADNTVGGSVSNTVVALKRLKPVNHLPVALCIVRPDRVDFRLINATFVRKLSSTSPGLTLNKCVGSINVPDVENSYSGVRNEPPNFRQLFGIHQKESWEKNFSRIVEASAKIKGRPRFEPAPEARLSILEGPTRAANSLSGDHFASVEAELQKRTGEKHLEIVDAARKNKPQKCGKVVEKILTGGPDKRSLEDLFFEGREGDRLYVDVKYKSANSRSNPKGYDIDKLLRFLANPRTVFALFFIVVDEPHALISARLVPVFDKHLLSHNRIAKVWSGRNTRGTVQFMEGFTEVLREDYPLDIDIEVARQFLLKLLDGP